MKTTRREFLGYSIAAGAVAACQQTGSKSEGSQGSSSEAKSAAAAPKKQLNLLVLGGTGFLGPWIVDEAQKRGHTLTLFNRGKTNPGLFPNIEQLHGDRDPKKGEGITAVKAVHVRPGPLVGNQVSIVDGLTGGERIVASGANLLRAGDVVKEIQ